MHRIIHTVALLIICLSSQNALAVGVIYCGLLNDKPACVAAVRYQTKSQSEEDAAALCKKWGINCTKSYALAQGCLSIAYSAANPPKTFGAVSGSSSKEAAEVATATCRATFQVPTCAPIFSFCETSSDPVDFGGSPAQYGPIDVSIKETPRVLNPGLLQLPSDFHFSDLLNFGAVGKGISFGLGIILALVIYAKRAALTNIIIHGRLPYKLPVYGEDIQCLFKRTQRVNWYGRVVFGIVVNLAMTHQQLIDIRKYWLGRVIAFDSLRRERQNMLAKLHLQRSSQLQIPKFKKLPWLFAAALTIIVPFIVALYFLLRALISFLLGFLFIRVSIARLVRGTIVESVNLTLVLQAKEAIEESATYLKEYLETANTFDGRDEIV